MHYYVGTIQYSEDMPQITQLREQKLGRAGNFNKQSLYIMFLIQDLLLFFTNSLLNVHCSNYNGALFH